MDGDARQSRQIAEHFRASGDALRNEILIRGCQNAPNERRHSIERIHPEKSILGKVLPLEGKLDLSAFMRALMRRNAGFAS